MEDLDTAYQTLHELEEEYSDRARDGEDENSQMMEDLAIEINEASNWVMYLESFADDEDVS